MGESDRIKQNVSNAKRIAELEAKVKRLEKALRTIAGEEQCVDNTMSNVAIARAALEGKG